MNQMNFLNGLAIATFLFMTILFFAIRSRPIVFHVLCAFLIAGFISWTGRSLSDEWIWQWMLLVLGLILYWFGLVIVRIMLTRSVSLQMLSDYNRREQINPASEGIARRLKDAKQFGLIVRSDDGFRLTPFGRVIGAIVASGYLILRIK